MDKLLIETVFMKKIISKIIARTIKKNLGICASIDLDKLKAEGNNDDITIEIGGTITIGKKDFYNIVMKEL